MIVGADRQSRFWYVVLGMHHFVYKQMHSGYTVPCTNSSSIWEHVELRIQTTCCCLGVPICWLKTWKLSPHVGSVLRMVDTTVEHGLSSETILRTFLLGFVPSAIGSV
jgi:hypothetical protein